MFSAILIFLIIACSQAQIPNTGPCMEIETPVDFNPTKILGQWYRYAAYPSGSPVGRCRQTIFIGNNDGTMTVIEKQLSVALGEFPIWEKVYVVKYLYRGNYLVTYPTDDILFNQTLMFWNTDYVSYTIKGGCVNIGQSSETDAWILTRSPHPSPSVVSKINEAVKIEGLQPQFFRKENQTDCPTNF